MLGEGKKEGRHGRQEAEDIYTEWHRKVVGIVPEMFGKKKEEKENWEEGMETYSKNRHRGWVQKAGKKAGREKGRCHAKARDRGVWEAIYGVEWKMESML